MKRFTFLIPLWILHTICISQELTPDTNVMPAFKNAVAFYNNTFAAQLRLFNGKEYKGYARPFNLGHPYFLTNTFSNGAVNYEGNDYEKVSILYNLVTDELIILDYAHNSKIQVNKQNVISFSIGEHSFINNGRDTSLSLNAPAGFYQVLVQGRVILLARRTKTIQEAVKQVVERNIYQKDIFYLRKGSDVLIINNKNGFLQSFGDKRKELQQFIKQNKLDYRKNQEDFLIRTVEYYNTITNP